MRIVFARCVTLFGLLATCACEQRHESRSIAVVVHFTNDWCCPLEIWCEGNWIGVIEPDTSISMVADAREVDGVGIIAIAKDESHYWIGAAKLPVERGPVLVVAGRHTSAAGPLRSRSASSVLPTHAELHAVRWATLLSQRPGTPARFADTLVDTNWNGATIRGIDIIVSSESRQVFQNHLGMKFVLVPSGEFLATYRGEEARVKLTDEFYMSVTEVTLAQWDAVFPDDGLVILDNGEMPMANVDWFMAGEFCDRLTCGRAVYALPTEAQWEFACRGGESALYSPSQVSIDRVMWSNSNAGGSPHHVGQLMPNRFGLYDMHGNLKEWCADWYHLRQAPRGVDPTGPTEPFVIPNSYTFSSPQRVRRGGSFDYYPSSGACNYRDACPPNERLVNTGFRPIVIIDRSLRSQRLHLSR